MHKGLHQAKEPFVFHTRLNLLELTGKRAKNLRELMDILEEASESVIYHHTHHFLQQHIYLSPEPANDFTYWVREALQEDVLAERLASIDLCEFNDLNRFRDEVVEIIGEHLRKTGRPLREAPPGEEFHFIKTITFILPTAYRADNLQEFLRGLQKVTVHSLYYHIFETRLRLKRPTNDFSYWLENSLGHLELAKRIERLDPYTHTMEGLRTKIAQLIEQRINSEERPNDKTA